MENKAPNAVPVVGLTGPTGAGKSTWAKAFASYGCIVIDCDALSRRAVEEPEVLAALQEAFGGDIVKDGALNRRLLAQRAFCGAGAGRALKRDHAPGHPRDAVQSLVRRESAASANDFCRCAAAV